MWVAQLTNLTNLMIRQRIYLFIGIGCSLIIQIIESHASPLMPLNSNRNGKKEQINMIACVVLDTEFSSHSQCLWYFVVQYCEYNGIC